ncbi:MAG TPA: hypothetical protein VMT03_10180 [Polyangia bacterium]|nr:hypothetical protein [Polyangia bacterium]
MKLVQKCVCGISAAVLSTLMAATSGPAHAQEVAVPVAPPVSDAPRPYALPPPPVSPPRYVPPPPPVPPPPAPPPPVRAPPPAAYVLPPPRYEPAPVYTPPEHDGFFLRMHFGGGWLGVSGINAAGAKTTISGASASLGVAVGFSIDEDLILFSNLFVTAADGPDVRTAGSTGTSKGSAGLGGAGIGLSYYIMPANFYVSGALAAMVFSLDDALGNAIYSTDAGLGVHGMIGKEWLLAPEWGMGFAVEGMFASMRDRNNPNVYWNGSAVSLLFSSTFN